MPLMRGDVLTTDADWAEVFTGDDITVEDVSSSYSYLSALGNAIYFAGAGKEADIDFTQVNSGSIYASFVLVVSDVSAVTKQGYFLAFLKGTSYEVRLFTTNVDSANNTYQLALGSGSSAGTTPSTTLNVGTAYLVVLKHDFNNNESSLFINSRLQQQ